MPTAYVDLPPGLAFAAGKFAQLIRLCACRLNRAPHGRLGVGQLGVASAAPVVLAIDDVPPRPARSLAHYVHAEFMAPR